ncbi:MAG: DUF1491 family protein [Pseudomonadota bacterium]
MRLKSELWVQAYLRRCALNDVPAVVLQRGQSDGGAIFVSVLRLDGTGELFGPAPAGLDAAAHDRVFELRTPAARVPEAELNRLIARERDFDPDLWVVEIESREGTHHLDDWLARDRDDGESSTGW